MLYNELFESDEPANKLFFHVTTKRRVPAITKQGIVSFGRHRRWQNSVGSKLGNRGYIYVISDFADAVKWAAKVDYDLNPDYAKTGRRNQPIVILCLQNVPTDQLEPDPNLEGQILSPGKWFQMKGMLEPEHIVRVIPLTDDMIKQVVRANQPEPSNSSDQPESPMVSTD